MRVKLSKWGNSLGLRLPKAVAEDLRPGQLVELSRVGDRMEIEIKPEKRRIPRYNLDEMLAEMKRRGPVEEPPLLDWGPDRGSEILPEDEYCRGEITYEDLLSRKNDPERR